jgi:hypothetical protein
LILLSSSLQLYLKLMYRNSNSSSVLSGKALEAMISLRAMGSSPASFAAGGGGADGDANGEQRGGSSRGQHNNNNNDVGGGDRDSGSSSLRPRRRTLGNLNPRHCVAGSAFSTHPEGDNENDMEDGLLGYNFAS